MKPTCYMCERQSNSKEHVPPRCIFPEEERYRINLLSVRSCDEHNLQKSDNDAYLMAVIAWHFENNEIARLQADKILRASKTNPRILKFLKTMGKRIVNGIFVDTLQLDTEAINTEIEHIARALYFKEFRKKYTSPLTVKVLSLAFTENSKKDFLNNLQIRELKSMMNTHMKRFPKQGSNPEIFYYQIGEGGDTERLFLRMVFYEGFEAFVISSKEDQP